MGIMKVVKISWGTLLKTKHLKIENKQVFEQWIEINRKTIHITRYFDQETFKYLLDENRFDFKIILNRYEK